MVNSKLKDKIYERVDYLRFTGKKWAKFISEQLTKELSRDVPISLIYEIINEIKKVQNNIEWAKEEVKTTNKVISKEKEKVDWGLKNMVDNVGEEKSYDYNSATDHIIFYPEGKPYPVLRETVQAMHEKYIRDWEWLTGKQMMYEFQLTAKARQYIKTVMGLMKDSTPFDKVTLSKIWSTEEMQKLAEEKAEQLTEAKMSRIYTKEVLKKKDRVVKKVGKITSFYDMFIGKLLVAIKTYNPRDFEDIKIPEIKNNDTLNVAITDKHLWKSNTDWVVIRMKKLTRDIIDRKEKNINITDLGDLGELFMPYWEMHPWQRIGMETINTEDLIMLIIDVFEQMLLSLYKAWKVITFNGMWGNHDRFTEKKEFDPYRTPAMIVYRFLERIVENTNIKVNILRDKLNVIKSGKTKFVYHHGDGLSPAQINRIALEQLEDWYYLVIISGDKHHFASKEISDRVLRIQSPALAGQGKYDKELNLSSLPWALFFENNKDWLIDIIVKRYK